MKSWFDDPEQPDTGHGDGGKQGDLPAADTVSWFDRVCFDDPEDTSVMPVVASQRLPVDNDAAGLSTRSGLGEGQIERRKFVAVAMLSVLGLLAAGGFALSYLTSRINQAPVAEEAALDTTANVSSPQAAASMSSSALGGASSPVSTSRALEKADLPAFAGKCADNGVDVSGGVELAASQDSLRAVVVAFNTAYYAQASSRLGEYLASDSSLRETDWDSVLVEAAPEGTSWCVLMDPAKANSVDVELTVTLPGQESVTFAQTVTGSTDGSGRWVIESIAAREK